VPVLSTSAFAQCPDQTFDFFEAQGYTVHQVLVRGPLLNASALRDDVVGPFVKAGSPVVAAGIEAGKSALRKLFEQTPSLFDSRAAATVINAAIDACNSSTKTLDVVYRVFTTKVPLALSRTFEGRSKETRDPAAHLAVAATPVHYRITPLLRYTALEHVVAGGRVTLNLPRAFDRLDAEVTASDVVLNADLELTGEHESEAGFIRRLEWSGGYHRHDRPTDDHEVKEEKVMGQLAALSRPLGSMGTVLRASTVLEGGRADTDFADADLPTAYLANVGYGTWKTAAGVTLRSRRHAWSGTYGLQLGFTSGTGGVDYTKWIGEVSYDGHFAAPTLSHYPLDVVTRLGFGRLSGDEGVPAAERFFGGNVAVPFLAGEQWDVRANPVLRSFPAFSFANPGNGTTAGGDYFLSYTLTASIPVWVKPLVPRDVSEDAFLRQAIAGMLTSAESTLETSYKISDPAHQRAIVASHALKAILESLEGRVQEILPTLSEPLKTAAQSCQDQVQTLMDAVDAISSKTYVGALLAEPVDEGDATLPSVVRACVDDFAAKLGDAALLERGSELATARTAIADQIAQIDVPAARRLAVRDMRFARETVATVLDEMNGIAIGPVFAFDVARLGQHQQRSSDLTRYGIGTGVRLSIASSLHLSAGYVWNANRARDERRGAAFAALELTTLLGR
jgi:hypothetical protein